MGITEKARESLDVVVLGARTAEEIKARGCCNDRRLRSRFRVVRMASVKKERKASGAVAGGLDRGVLFI